MTGERQRHPTVWFFCAETSRIFIGLGSYTIMKMTKKFLKFLILPIAFEMQPIHNLNIGIPQMPKAFYRMEFFKDGKLQFDNENFEVIESGCV